VAKGKRKHVATGQPKGGSRSGAGRKPGSKNALDYGEVAAVAAAKLRVPEGADPSVQKLAARALERIADVMEEKVWEKQGRNVLAAATRIREEACGPLSQKVEITGRLDGLTDEQLEERLRKLTVKAAEQTEPAA
jgi:hypothetical protein